MKGARYTMKRNRLFLPIFSWAFGHLHLPGLAGEVEFARFCAMDLKYGERKSTRVTKLQLSRWEACRRGPGLRLASAATGCDIARHRIVPEELTERTPSRPYMSLPLKGTKEDPYETE